jgi:selenocysteine-specific elongation factor
MRLVIGTAGHVDHGKTSLVKALTGVDLDRLPEEKERGITIALGFTPLKLPSGRVAGLVDVPGHERLVRTMVAGASGMDAVMLCVSASEGVMPQTREHLAILELLGVKTGVLVLTMADLVEPDLLALCEEELREQVRGTFLDGAPAVATSAVTRAGLDQLVAVLDAIVPPARPLDVPFRLPVDRAFARRGFGTVVTGTAWGGKLRDGDEIEVRPGGRRARVRGVQVHGATVAEAEAGARTALNLAGVEMEEVSRGSWVCAPGAVPDAHVIDARYTHLEGAPEYLEEARLVVLHGTREVDARVVPLDDDGLYAGKSCLVQIRAAEPLPCLPGDRFVVRRASPAATVGGGTILDPWAPVARKKDVPGALATLRRLEAGDTTAWLDRAGPAGLAEDEARARGVTGGVRLGDRRFGPDTADRLRVAVGEALARFHRENPLSPGANRKALRDGPLLALDERSYQALLDAEAAAGRLVLEGGRVRAPDWTVRLAGDEAAWRDRTLAALRAAALEGGAELPEHPRKDALAFYLRDKGEIEQIADRWYDAATLAALSGRVRGFFETRAELDPAAFKDLTGLTRRTAIPLLEWLDAHGVTKRRGDVRVRA